MAHQAAGAYPGFCSTKRLGVFLLPPGWDASPLQGYVPQALNSSVPIYTPGRREALFERGVNRFYLNLSNPYVIQLEKPESRFFKI